MAVVVAGLLGLLLLNTLVAQDSFHVHRLEKDSSALREREETLKTEVAKLKAPGILANRATGLGLVPGNTPGFVRLRDGRVIGEPKTALAPPVASLVPAAPATALAPPVPSPVPSPVAAAKVPAGVKVPAGTKAPAVTNPGLTKAKSNTGTAVTKVVVTTRVPAKPPAPNAPKPGRARRG